MGVESNCSRHHTHNQTPRSFLPAVARLRSRLEGKAAAAACAEPRTNHAVVTALTPRAPTHNVVARANRRRPAPRSAGNQSYNWEGSQGYTQGHYSGPAADGGMGGARRSPPAAAPGTWGGGEEWGGGAW